MNYRKLDLNFVLIFFYGLVIGLDVDWSEVVWPSSLVGMGSSYSFPRPLPSSRWMADIMCKQYLNWDVPIHITGCCSRDVHLFYENGIGKPRRNGNWPRSRPEKLERWKITVAQNGYYWREGGPCRGAPQSHVIYNVNVSVMLKLFDGSISYNHTERISSRILTSSADTQFTIHRSLYVQGKSAWTDTQTPLSL